MGFLTKLFKSKENMYIEQLYKDAKEEKQRLYAENQELKNNIEILQNENFKLKQELFLFENNIKTSKQKALTKLEENIYNIFKQNSPINLLNLSKLTNVKKNSLKVYLSKIRKKGFEIKLNK